LKKCHVLFEWPQSFRKTSQCGKYMCKRDVATCLKVRHLNGSANSLTWNFIENSLILNSLYVFGIWGIRPKIPSNKTLKILRCGRLSAFFCDIVSYAWLENFLIVTEVFTSCNAMKIYRIYSCISRIHFWSHLLKILSGTN